MSRCGTSTVTRSWMQDRIDQLEWDMKMMEEQTPYAAIQYIRESISATMNS